MNSGVTMDKVVISIESDAGKATSGIDKLTVSLGNLKTAISGGFNNLNTLSTALEKLTSIDLSSISGNIAKPVKEISKALEPLSEVQGGGFASAVRGLNQLKTAVVGLESIPSSLGPVKEIATAFEPLSQIKSGGFNNVVKGLDNLKSSSEGLSSTASNTAGVKEIASNLRELENIKTASFNKTVNALVKLKNEAEGLGDTAGKMGSIKGIADALKPLESIKTTGFNSAVKQLEKLPTVMASITPQALENVGRVSTELANKLTPLADKLDQIGNGYKAISALADKYGVSVTKIRTNTSSTTKITDKFKNVLSALVSPFKKVNSSSNAFLNAAQKGFSKLHSKVKQIGLSLLGTRTIFTATRKAVSEYMNMDVELSNQLSNIWRGLGALLAPAIEQVIYIFKQLARVIYSVVKAITGYDLIARANAKATSAWGKSAEDALGSLQKFDDLNVVDFGKTAGDSTDLIDLTEIDLTPIQWIIDAIKKIKKAIEDAFDTGKWRGVGEALSEGFNEFLTKTNPVLIFEKVETLAKNISEVINGWFSKLDGKQLGENIQNALLIIPNFLNTALTNIEFDVIGQRISEVLSGINFETLIVNISDVLVNIVDGIQTALLNIDTETLANSLSQIAVGLLTAINNMLSTIKWDEVGTKLHDVIVKMDWKGILESVWETIKSALSAIGKTFAGLIFGDTFESETAAIWTGIAVVIGGILVTTLLPLITSGLFDKLKTSITDKLGLGSSKSSSSKSLTQDEGLGSMFDSLGEAGKKIGIATEIIAILGGLALVITTITNLLKTFAETGMSTGDAMLLIGVVLGEIAVAFVVLAAATKLLNTEDTLVILALLGGLSLTILSIATALEMINKLGLTNMQLLGQMSIIVASIVVLLAALVVSALILGSNPLALIAIVALSLSLSVILLSMAVTIPIILNAVSTFITSTAPAVIAILNTIGNLIQGIIYAMGTVLPPIIKAVGSVFNTIFNGISKVILSVGQVIVNIMNTAGNLVDKVLNSILNFINKLGPAINNFVDNCIIAVTKLINFLISGIEYMINTLVIGGINSMIKGINKIIPGDSWDISLIEKVTIDRFVPKLATGTNEIEYEGLYHLHQGEAVVPKKYNPAIGNGGGNEEMLAKFDKLISLIENQEQTTIVNVGNKTLYKEQQSYNKMQNNKYGTITI